MEINNNIKKVLIEVAHHNVGEKLPEFDDTPLTAVEEHLCDSVSELCLSAETLKGLENSGFSELAEKLQHLSNVSQTRNWLLHELGYKS